MENTDPDLGSVFNKRSSWAAFLLDFVASCLRKPDIHPLQLKGISYIFEIYRLSSTYASYFLLFSKECQDWAFKQDVAVPPRWITVLAA